MPRRSSLTWNSSAGCVPRARHHRRGGRGRTRLLAGPVFARRRSCRMDCAQTSQRLKDARGRVPRGIKRVSLWSTEVCWAIGVASVEEIETHNILQASLLACVARSRTPLQPHLCLIDGNQKAGLACRELTVIDGDARCPSIAAASVIAKVARDRAMAELAALYPGYGLENHKGYGTRNTRVPLPFTDLAQYIGERFNRYESTPAPKLATASEIGAYGERVAAAFVRRHGYRC